MGQIIEAKAVISAEDRTGKAFDSIARKFRDVGKGAKVAGEVGKLAKELDRAHAGLKEIERFRSTQASFSGARTAFRGAQAEVGRIAKELDAARKAATAFDGIRSFSKTGAVAKEMAAARKQVAELERQFDQAQRTIRAASGAYETQAAALKHARREAESSGVSVGKVVAEQNRLRAAVDGVTASILKQEAAARAESRLAAGMGASGRAASARLARDRYLIDGMSAPARQREAEHLRHERELADKHARLRASASGDLVAGMGVSGRQTAERIDSGRRLADGMSEPARREHAERERRALEAAEAKAQRQAERRDAMGTVAAGAGIYLGHKGKQIGIEAIDAAAAMDYAVRYQHIATDVSEARQQSLLLPQAKRIGQETRFSNLDVVKAQTTSMQGLPYKDADLKAQVGAAIVEEARNYAVVLQSTLTNGSEGLRSFLQNTNKDLSTPEKAIFEAQRGTNLIVKAAKLGGMNDEDAQQYMKFGLPTATQAGFSDVSTMALGALARRSGLRGEEAGVFVRAAASKLISPTKEGREAEIMAGIDRSKYQTMPEQLNAEAFEKIGKGRFGVSFDTSQRERLGAMFRNGDLVTDREEFVKQVSDVVGESFEKDKKGKTKAQDASKIAKLANDFYKMSVQSTDVQGLLEAHMSSPAFTAALRNKFYTDKHGGKAGILGQHFDQFKEDTAELEQVTKTPLFARDRAQYMTKGLGGSMDNLKGSYETAVLNWGTANAPMIQSIADGLAAVGDAIGNLPQQAIQAGTAIVALGGMATTAASALSIIGKFTGSTVLAEAGAGIGAATFTGAPLAAGALAGGWLDWNFGGNTGALGMLTGNESDHQKTMRYLRERQAADDASRLIGYGQTGPRMTMPGPAEGMPAFPTTIRSSRGRVGDFLWGQQKTDIVLPTSGRAGLPAGGGTIPVEVVSLPDRKDASGQVEAINNTLDKAASASATAANGGKPIEASVKPDQITARIDALPPVSGSADVKVENQVEVRVTLNSDLLDAKVNAAAGRAVAKIPLSSSGARPGAVSMPGAASTPGAK